MFENRGEYNMVQKRLEKIEFAFESVEIGEVPSEAIEDIRFTGLRQVGDQHFKDGAMIFSQNLVTRRFLIKLDYELANQNYTNYDEPVGKRLYEHNDIVDVTLYFEDGTSETVDLPWSENAGNDNDWQRSSINIKRPLNKVGLEQISPDLSELMNNFEQNDRFTNREILTICVRK